MITQAHVVSNHLVAQANRGVWPQHNASTLASKICDFLRMNGHTFNGSKVDEDPQIFLYEVFNMLDAMGVIDKEKLVPYQLKDVAQVWFGKGRD